MYYDLMIKIISDLSVREICKFVNLSKWTHSFDTIKGWHDIMLCKGLVEETYALRNYSELIIDELVKMRMNRSFCSLGIPKNKSIEGLVGNYETFAETANHEYAKIYNKLMNMPETQVDENFARSYFNNNPINIYKLYLFCTVRHFELIGQQFHEANNCKSVQIFSDDPLMLIALKKTLKTNKSEYISYGNKNPSYCLESCIPSDRGSTKETSTLNDTTSEKTSLEKTSPTNNFDLKSQLQSLDNIKDHKHIVSHYKYKYDLCNGLILPENRRDVLKFDTKLINYIEDPSEEEIKLVAKKNPKDLLRLCIKSEPLQLYCLKKMNKKIRSGKLLKYLRNPTQATINCAIKMSLDNVKYISSIDKLFEAFKANPNMNLFVQIIRTYKINDEFNNRCALIYPKIIRHMKVQPLELIHAIIEKDPENIEMIYSQNINAEFIAWYCDKKFDIDILLKHCPVAINLIPRDDLKKFLFKNPKVLEEFIKQHDDQTEDLLQSLVLENRDLIVSVYCKLYNIIDLLNPDFSHLFGLTLNTEDFIKNYKLYLKLEKSIALKIERNKSKEQTKSKEKSIDEEKESLESDDQKSPKSQNKGYYYMEKDYGECPDNVTVTWKKGSCDSCPCGSDSTQQTDYKSSSKHIKIATRSKPSKSEKQANSSDELPELEDESPKGNKSLKTIKSLISHKIKELKKNKKLKSKDQKISILGEEELGNLIINIRKSVIDKHPYLLSYMLVGGSYPENFKDSQIYNQIIENSIKKYPAIVEIFKNIPEGYQTQAIVCSPQCAGNLSVPLSKKAQELALILNPFENAKRIHLDDEIFDKNAMLNPYCYTKTRNPYLVDVIHRRRMFLAKQLLPSEFFDNKDYISSVKKIKNITHEAGYDIMGNTIYIIKKSQLTQTQLNKIIVANAKFAERILSHNSDSPRFSRYATSVSPVQGLQQVQQFQQQLQQLQQQMQSRLKVLKMVKNSKGKSSTVDKSDENAAETPDDKNDNSERPEQNDENENTNDTKSDNSDESDDKSDNSDDNSSDNSNIRRVKYSGISSGKKECIIQ